MGRNPLIYIGIFLVIVALLISLMIFFMFTSEGSVKTDASTDKQDTVKVIEDVADLSKQIELKIQSDGKVLSATGAKNMEEYNKLLFTIDDFFTKLNEEEYENAYDHVDPLYKQYKKLNNLNEFVKYVKDVGYDNISCQVNAIYRIKGNTQKYLTDVTLFKRYGGEEYSSGEAFKSSIDNGNYINEYIVVTYDESFGYYLSFDGLLGLRDFGGLEQTHGLIKIVLLDELAFADNTSILRLKIENNRDTPVNAGDLFEKIICYDEQGRAYEADKLPNSAEYELISGQSREFYLKVKHGRSMIKTVTYILK